jgi:hypothetical protein
MCSWAAPVRHAPCVFIKQDYNAVCNLYLRLQKVHSTLRERHNRIETVIFGTAVA